MLKMSAQLRGDTALKIAKSNLEHIWYFVEVEVSEGSAKARPLVCLLPSALRVATSYPARLGSSSRNSSPSSR